MFLAPATWEPWVGQVKCDARVSAKKRYDKDHTLGLRSPPVSLSHAKADMLSAINDVDIKTCVVLA
jgi:hypothetical protein